MGRDKSLRLGETSHPQYSLRMPVQINIFVNNGITRPEGAWVICPYDGSAKGSRHSHIWRLVRDGHLNMLKGPVPTWT